MRYNQDVKEFREKRGISKMKFCELAGIAPSVLTTVEKSFANGWAEGDSLTVKKIEDTINFITRKSIKVSQGRQSFQVTWKDENGTAFSKAFTLGTSLNRGLFQ